MTTKRHSIHTPEALAKKWRIGIETARETIAATTQLGIRQAIHPLTRRYRTDTMALRQRRLKNVIYTDTLFAKTKSIKGNKCMQVYCNEDLIRVILLSHAQTLETPYRPL